MECTIERSLNERTAELFRTGRLSDVTFVVGVKDNQKTFKAHKLLLAAASDVFEAMFYGSMAETSDAIKIPDLDPVGFQKMLEYIYLDSADMETAQTALLTLEAASKYMIPHLKEICALSAMERLTVNNACELLESVILYGASKAALSVLYFICTDASKVLSSPSFYKTGTDTVKKIVRQEFFNASEEEIIAAVVKWGLVKSGKPFNCPEGRIKWSDVRSFVDTLLPHLQFDSLTAEKFVSLPLESKLLSEGESLSFLMNISRPGSKPFPKWFVRTKKRTLMPKLQAVGIPSEYNNASSTRQCKSTEVKHKFSVNTGCVVLISVRCTAARNSQKYGYYNDYYDAYGRRVNCQGVRFEGTLTFQNITDNYKTSWNVSLEGTSQEVPFPFPQVVYGGETCEISFRKRDSTNNPSVNAARGAPISMAKMIQCETKSQTQKIFTFHSPLEKPNEKPEVSLVSMTFAFLQNATRVGIMDPKFVIVPEAATYTIRQDSWN